MKKNKKIVLGMCGSVAAVRCVELVREFVRRGLEVEVTMTKAAQKIVAVDAMIWASENPVITGLTGKVEYLKSCGVEGDASLLLICPATANTISKIAAGIDDTTVTTYASTALGSGCPIIVVPAMHESLYNNPFVAEALDKMKKAGIEVLEPKREEGIAKLPDEEEIIKAVDKKIKKINST
ncbi:MAG: flavoprotein [Candidatus Altiarchaeota archaeon]